MPCFRGIDISLRLREHNEKLPEFPHPDASSVRILFSSPSQTSLETQSPSKIDSSRVQKANPKVSVYIPSIPSCQFSVDYAIIRTPEPSCYLFFKLSINGRNLVNWGINPALKANGTISRALYEPCGRWHAEKGTRLQIEGIESRSFYFTPKQASSSIADDGGLIEIKVFRARRRRRASPRLAQYRSQDHYGVTSPSDGLLEFPEDASYYDWVLIDPRDSAFASFCFHYRKWENLRQLNLVQGHQVPTVTIPALRSGISEAEASDSSHFPKAISNLQSILHARDASTATLGHPPPNLNTQSSTLDEPSRKSMESFAPSIAPSLLPYIDDTLSSDETEYGTAIKLPISQDYHQLSGSQRPLPKIPHRSRQHGSRLLPGANQSLSSQDQIGDSATKRISSASHHINEASNTEKKQPLQASLREWSVREFALDEKQVRARPVAPGISELLAGVDSLRLSESEWMKRAVSCEENLNGTK